MWIHTQKKLHVQHYLWPVYYTMQYIGQRKGWTSNLTGCLLASRWTYPRNETFIHQQTSVTPTPPSPAPEGISPHIHDVFNMPTYKIIAACIEAGIHDVLVYYYYSGLVHSTVDASRW